MCVLYFKCISISVHFHNLSQTPIKHLPAFVLVCCQQSATILSGALHLVTYQSTFLTNKTEFGQKPNNNNNNNSKIITNVFSIKPKTKRGWLNFSHCFITLLSPLTELLLFLLDDIRPAICININVHFPVFHD